VNGLWIYILHDLGRLDLDPAAGGFSAVISGHSHKPAMSIRSGVVYLNPGAAGPRRFTLPVSVGRLVVEDGAIRAEVIEL
jgi:predicted phosphodiesterase